MVLSRGRDSLADRSGALEEGAQGGPNQTVGFSGRGDVGFSGGLAQRVTKRRR